MARTGWTREQLLAALALYCQIPFSRMTSRNPLVIAAAMEIGRTPSAVAMKLGNFASLDPELKARGIKGMANSSEADRAIWAEFYGKWELLSGQVKVTVERAAAEEREFVWAGGPTEVLREVKQRRAQGFFRAAVLAVYAEQCCITGIAERALLRASHIVPWHKEKSLQANPRNGLCLNALHDLAFDRGLITLTEKREVRIAKRLKKQMPREVWEGMFQAHEGKEVRMPERLAPEAEYLKWHREEVFAE